MDRITRELQQTIRSLQQIVSDLTRKKRSQKRPSSKYQHIYQKLEELKKQQQLIQQDDDDLKENQTWIKKSIIILMNELRDNQGNVIPHWGLINKERPYKN